MGVACKMILRKHIEDLQYKIELLKTMLTKSQNNKYIKRDEAPELTTVHKKADAKEVPYYTSSDNVDMLI